MSGRQEEELRRLREELRAYGRSLDGTAGGETMAERVVARILAEQLPVPEPPSRSRVRAVRHWSRTRWRSLLAALCGLLTVLVLTPPVRATVSDWFGFHGVQVRHDPSAVPSPDARVPDCTAPVRLEEAARRAGFSPVVPEALGPPDTVSARCERDGNGGILLGVLVKELDRFGDGAPRIGGTEAVIPDHDVHPDDATTWRAA